MHSSIPLFTAAVASVLLASGRETTISCTDDVGRSELSAIVRHMPNKNKCSIITRHLRCVVSPPIIITKCTDGEYGNYDLTIIILWNNHYNLNFNAALSDDSKK